MKLRGWILLAVVPAFAACGGGDDGPPKSDPFEGVYEVTSFTENPASCTAEGPEEVYDDPYFKLDIDTFFGTRLLAYYSCTSPTVCDEESILITSSFEEDNGDNWTIAIQYAFHGGGTNCTIGETVKTLTGDPDLETSIMVRGEQSSTDQSLDEDACVGDNVELEDLVDEYRDQMTCESLDVLRADRVVDTSG